MNKENKEESKKSSNDSYPDPINYENE